MRSPEGLTGKYRDLMPPPLKGIDICMLALNAIAARHAVIARIKHLSLAELEIGALIS